MPAGTTAGHGMQNCLNLLSPSSPVLNRQHPPPEVWAALVERLMGHADPQLRPPREAGRGMAGFGPVSEPNSGLAPGLLEAMDVQQLVELSAGLASLKAGCVGATAVARLPLLGEG